MSELVKALSNFVYKRFTIKKKAITGNHFYIYGPTGESVPNNEEVWSVLKKDVEVYNRIREEAGLDGLEESDFDRQALNCLHSVPCTEEIIEDSDDDITESDEVVNKVKVTNFSLKSPAEDCEYFLKQFDRAKSAKRLFVKKGTEKEFRGSYEVTFEDKECAVKFEKLPELRFGKKLLKTELLYSCDQCPKSFISKFRLKKHRNRVHSKQIFQCPTCPQSFTRKDHLEQHNLTKHGNSEFICITCRTKFKTERALDKHLEFGEFCSFQCVYCTRTFTRKPNLLRHKKICNTIDDSGGTCEVCSEEFEFQIELERHRKSSTKPDGSAKCQCRYCGKPTCNFKMLGDHLRAEHPQYQRIQVLPAKVFPCENCGKSFKSKMDMMSHLSTHISSKSRTKSVAKLPEIFECDQCHSKFTLRKNYRRHVKLVYDEAGNPRNLCGMCGNLFCNAKQLKKHYAEAHKGYSCSICDQSFSTKRALENHIKKQSSFKCYECEKTYCSKKILRVHMKYVHSIKV